MSDQPWSEVCENGRKPVQPNQGTDPHWARRPSVFAARRTDWRCGSIVYQLIVDRFAPSRRLDLKRECYASPRSLHAWEELPTKGAYNHEAMNSSAELMFWGGDLDSVHQRVDYLQELGVEVVYLNPIFEAFTNHKYDATDYFRVDPQYGTNEELHALCRDLHSRGMRMMLDGVFNHMGRRAPVFQNAREDQEHEHREHFYFGEEFKHGHRGWRNVANLPELNLENPAVREFLWEGHDSVVRTYLREYGIDGWRLDVAPDIGFQYLSELTAAAHETKPDCVIIGECWNYPEEWLHVMDGILNMHTRTLMLEFAQGKLTPRATGRALERMVEDSGIDGILRCHLVLENHDTPRTTTIIEDENRRALAQALQFTLPGCPVIYYGAELGMAGGADPLNRAPMRWELLEGENSERKRITKLLEIRRDNPALRVGDFRLLDGDRLLAFLRLTDRARETMIVVLNPTDATVTDIFPVRDSRLMDAANLECVYTGEHATMHCGFLEVTLPAHGIRVFRTADRGTAPGYSMFKRVP